MRFLIVFVLSLILTGPPALAAGFSFPHIKIVRGFDTAGHPQTLEMIGGVSPHARLPIGPAAQGATVRIHGNATAVSGTVSFIAGGNVELQMTSAGAFDQTFTLANATDYIQVTGGTGDTATFTALHVDVS